MSVSLLLSRVVTTVGSLTVLEQVMERTELQVGPHPLDFLPPVLTVEALCKDAALGEQSDAEAIFLVHMIESH